MMQKEKDAVTVGDIRKVLTDRLELQIDTLSKLIRQWCHKRHDAQKYHNEAIASTLEEIDKLDSWAGLPSLMKSLNGGA